MFFGAEHPGKKEKQRGTPKNKILGREHTWSSMHRLFLLRLIAWNKLAETSLQKGGQSKSNPNLNTAHWLYPDARSICFKGSTWKKQANHHPSQPQPQHQPSLQATIKISAAQEEDPSSQAMELIGHFCRNATRFSPPSVRCMAVFVFLCFFLCCSCSFRVQIENNNEVLW